MAKPNSDVSAPRRVNFSDPEQIQRQDFTTVECHIEGSDSKARRVIVMAPKEQMQDLTPTEQHRFLNPFLEQMSGVVAQSATPIVIRIGRKEEGYTPALRGGRLPPTATDTDGPLTDEPLAFKKMSDRLRQLKVRPRETADIGSTSESPTYSEATESTIANLKEIAQQKEAVYREKHQLYREAESQINQASNRVSEVEKKVEKNRKRQKEVEEKIIHALEKLVEAQRKVRAASNGGELENQKAQLVLDEQKAQKAHKDLLESEKSIEEISKETQEELAKAYEEVRQAKEAVVAPKLAFLQADAARRKAEYEVAAHTKPPGQGFLKALVEATKAEYLAAHYEHELILVGVVNVCKAGCSSIAARGNEMLGALLKFCRAKLALANHNDSSEEIYKALEELKAIRHQYVDKGLSVPDESTPPQTLIAIRDLALKKASFTRAQLFLAKANQEDSLKATAEYLKAQAALLQTVEPALQAEITLHLADAAILKSAPSRYEIAKAKYDAADAYLKYAQEKHIADVATAEVELHKAQQDLGMFMAPRSTEKRYFGPSQLLDIPTTRYEFSYNLPDKDGTRVVQSTADVVDPKLEFNLEGGLKRIREATDSERVQMVGLEPSDPAPLMEESSPIQNHATKINELALNTLDAIVSRPFEYTWYNIAAALLNLLSKPVLALYNFFTKRYAPIHERAAALGQPNSDQSEFDTTIISRKTALAQIDFVADFVRQEANRIAPPTLTPVLKAVPAAATAAGQTPANGAASEPPPSALHQVAKALKQAVDIGKKLDKARFEPTENTYAMKKLGQPPKKRNFWEEHFKDPTAGANRPNKLLFPPPQLPRTARGELETTFKKFFNDLPGENDALLIPISIGEGQSHQMHLLLFHRKTDAFGDIQYTLKHIRQESTTSTSTRLSQVDTYNIPSKIEDAQSASFINHLISLNQSGSKTASREPRRGGVDLTMDQTLVDYFGEPQQGAPQESSNDFTRVLYHAMHELSAQRESAKPKDKSEERLALLGNKINFYQTLINHHIRFINTYQERLSNAELIANLQGVEERVGQLRSYLSENEGIGLDAAEQITAPLLTFIREKLHGSLGIEKREREDRDRLVNLAAEPFVAETMATSLPKDTPLGESAEQVEHGAIAILNHRTRQNIADLKAALVVPLTSSDDETRTHALHQRLAAFQSLMKRLEDLLDASRPKTARILASSLLAALPPPAIADDRDSHWNLIAAHDDSPEQLAAAVERMDQWISGLSQLSERMLESVLKSGEPTLSPKEALRYCSALRLIMTALSFKKIQLMNHENGVATLAVQNALTANGVPDPKKIEALDNAKNQLIGGCKAKIAKTVRQNREAAWAKEDAAYNRELEAHYDSVALRESAFKEYQNRVKIFETKSNKLQKLIDSAKERRELAIKAFDEAESNKDTFETAQELRKKEIAKRARDENNLWDAIETTLWKAVSVVPIGLERHVFTQAFAKVKEEKKLFLSSPQLWSNFEKSLLKAAESDLQIGTAIATFITNVKSSETDILPKLKRLHEIASTSSMISISAPTKEQTEKQQRLLEKAFDEASDKLGIARYHWQECERALKNYQESDNPGAFDEILFSIKPKPADRPPDLEGTRQSALEAETQKAIAESSDLNQILQVDAGDFANLFTRLFDFNAVAKWMPNMWRTMGHYAQVAGISEQTLTYLLAHRAGPHSQIGAMVHNIWANDPSMWGEDEVTLKKHISLLADYTQFIGATSEESAFFAKCQSAATELQRQLTALRSDHVDEHNVHLREFALGYHAGSLEFEEREKEKSRSSGSTVANRLDVCQQGFAPDKATSQKWLVPFEFCQLRKHDLSVGMLEAPVVVLQKYRSFFVTELLTSVFSSNSIETAEMPQVYRQLAQKGRLYLTFAYQGGNWVKGKTDDLSGCYVLSSVKNPTTSTLPPEVSSSSSTSSSSTTAAPNPKQTKSKQKKGAKKKRVTDTPGASNASGTYCLMQGYFAKAYASRTRLPYLGNISAKEFEQGIVGSKAGRITEYFTDATFTHVPALKRAESLAQHTRSNQASDADRAALAGRADLQYLLDTTAVEALDDSGKPLLSYVYVYDAASFAQCMDLLHQLITIPAYSDRLIDETTGESLLIHLYDRIVQRNVLKTIMEDNPGGALNYAKRLRGWYNYCTTHSDNRYAHLQPFLLSIGTALRAQAQAALLNPTLNFGRDEQRFLQELVDIIPCYERDETMSSLYTNGSETEYRRLYALHLLHDYGLQAAANTAPPLDPAKLAESNARVSRTLQAHAILNRTPATMGHSGLIREVQNYLSEALLPDIVEYIQKLSSEQRNGLLNSIAFGKPTARSGNWQFNATTNIYSLPRFSDKGLPLKPFEISLETGRGVHLTPRPNERERLPNAMLDNDDFKRLFGYDKNTMPITEVTTPEPSDKKLKLYSWTISSIEGHSYDTTFQILYRPAEAGREQIFQIFQRVRGQRYQFSPLTLDRRSKVTSLGYRQSQYIEHLVQEKGIWSKVNERGVFIEGTEIAYIAQGDSLAKDPITLRMAYNRISGATVGGLDVCTGVEGDVDLLPFQGCSNLLLLAEPTTIAKQTLNEIRFQYALPPAPGSEKSMGYETRLVLKKESDDRGCTKWRVPGQDLEWQQENTAALEKMLGADYRTFVLPLQDKTTKENRHTVQTRRLILYPYWVLGNGNERLQVRQPKDLLKLFRRIATPEQQNALLEFCIEKMRERGDGQLDKFLIEMGAEHFTLDLLQAIIDKSDDFLDSRMKELMLMILDIQLAKQGLVGSLDELVAASENVDQIVATLKALRGTNGGPRRKGAASRLLNPDPLVLNIDRPSCHASYLYMAYIQFLNGSMTAASRYLELMVKQGVSTTTAEREQLQDVARMVLTSSLDINQLFPKDSHHTAFFLKALLALKQIEPVLSTTTGQPFSSSAALLPLVASVIANNAGIEITVPLKNLIQRVGDDLLNLVFILIATSYRRMPASQKLALKEKGLLLTAEEDERLAQMYPVDFDIRAADELFLPLAIHHKLIPPQWMSFIQLARELLLGVAPPPPDARVMSVPTQQEIEELFIAVIENNTHSSLKGATAEERIKNLEAMRGNAPKVDTLLEHFFDYVELMMDGYLEPGQIRHLYSPVPDTQPFASQVRIAQRFLLMLYYRRKDTKFTETEDAILGAARAKAKELPDFAALRRSMENYRAQILEKQRLGAVMGMALDAGQMVASREVGLAQKSHFKNRGGELYSKDGPAQEMHTLMMHALWKFAEDVQGMEFAIYLEQMQTRVIPRVSATSSSSSSSATHTTPTSTTNSSSSSSSSSSSPENSYWTAIDDILVKAVKAQVPSLDENVIREACKNIRAPMMDYWRSPTAQSTETWNQFETIVTRAIKPLCDPLGIIKSALAITAIKANLKRQSQLELSLLQLQTMVSPARSATATSSSSSSTTSADEENRLWNEIENALWAVVKDLPVSLEKSVFTQAFAKVRAEKRVFLGSPQLWDNFEESLWRAAEPELQKLAPQNFTLQMAFAMGMAKGTFLTNIRNYKINIEPRLRELQALASSTSSPSTSSSSAALPSTSESPPVSATSFLFEEDRSWSEFENSLWNVLRSSLPYIENEFPDFKAVTAALPKESHETAFRFALGLLKPAVISCLRKRDFEEGYETFLNSFKSAFTTIKAGSALMECINHARQNHGGQGAAAVNPPNPLLEGLALIEKMLEYSKTEEFDETYRSDTLESRAAPSTSKGLFGTIKSTASQLAKEYRQAVARKMATKMMAAAGVFLRAKQAGLLNNPDHIGPLIFAALKAELEGLHKKSHANSSTGSIPAAPSSKSSTSSSSSSQTKIEPPATPSSLGGSTSSVSSVTQPTTPTAKTSVAAADPPITIYRVGVDRTTFKKEWEKPYFRQSSNEALEKIWRPRAKHLMESYSDSVATTPMEKADFANKRQAVESVIDDLKSRFSRSLSVRAITGAGGLIKKNEERLAAVEEEFNVARQELLKEAKAFREALAIRDPSLKDKQIIDHLVKLAEKERFARLKNPILQRKFLELVTHMILVETEMHNLKLADSHLKDFIVPHLVKMDNALTAKGLYESNVEVRAARLQLMADGDIEWLMRTADIHRMLSQGTDRLRYSSKVAKNISSDPEAAQKDDRISFRPKLSRSSVLTTTYYTLGENDASFGTSVIDSEGYPVPTQRIALMYLIQDWKTGSEAHIMREAQKEALDKLAQGEQLALVRMGLGKTTVIFPQAIQWAFSQGRTPILETSEVLLHQLIGHLPEGSYFEICFDANYGIKLPKGKKLDETDEKSGDKELILSQLDKLYEMLTRLPKEKLVGVTSPPRRAHLRNLIHKKRRELWVLEKAKSPKADAVHQVLEKLLLIQSCFRDPKVVIFQDEDDNCRVDFEYNLASGAPMAADPEGYLAAQRIVMGMMQEPTIYREIISDSLRAVSNPIEVLKPVIRDIAADRKFWLDAGWSEQEWRDYINKDEFVEFITQKDKKPSLGLELPKDLASLLPAEKEVRERKYKIVGMLKTLTVETFESVYGCHMTMDRGIDPEDGQSVVPYSDGMPKPMTKYGNPMELYMHTLLHYGRTTPKPADADKEPRRSLMDEDSFLAHFKLLSRSNDDTPIAQPSNLSEEQARKFPTSWTRWATNISAMARLKYGGDEHIYQAFLDPELWRERLMLLKEMNFIREYEEQITCPAPLLVQGIDFRIASGTADPYANGVDRPGSSVSVSAQKIIVETLLLYGNKITQEVQTFDSDKTFERILHWCQNPNCIAVINPAFEVQGTENRPEILASRCSQFLQRRKKPRQILYRDSRGNKKYILNPGQAPIPYEVALIDQKNCIALLGASDYRGVDFRLPKGKGKFAALMHDASMNEDKGAQAIMRARQFGFGQDGVLDHDQKMLKKTREALSLPSQKVPTHADSFVTSTKKSVADKELIHTKAAIFSSKKPLQMCVDNWDFQPLPKAIAHAVDTVPQAAELIREFRALSFELHRDFCITRNSLNWQRYFNKKEEVDSIVFMNNLYHVQAEKLEALKMAYEYHKTNFEQRVRQVPTDAVAKYNYSQTLNYVNEQIRLLEVAYQAAGDEIMQQAALFRAPQMISSSVTASGSAPLKVAIPKPMPAVGRSAPQKAWDDFEKSARPQIAPVTTSSTPAPQSSTSTTSQSKNFSKGAATKFFQFFGFGSSSKPTSEPPTTSKKSEEVEQFEEFRRSFNAIMSATTEEQFVRARQDFDTARQQSTIKSKSIQHWVTYDALIAAVNDFGRDRAIYQEFHRKNLPQTIVTSGASDNMSAEQMVQQLQQQEQMQEIEQEQINHVQQQGVRNRSARPIDFAAFRRGAKVSANCGYTHFCDHCGPSNDLIGNAQHQISRLFDKYRDICSALEDGIADIYISDYARELMMGIGYRGQPVYSVLIVANPPRAGEPQTYRACIIDVMDRQEAITPALNQERLAVRRGGVPGPLTAVYSPAGRIGDNEVSTDGVETADQVRQRMEKIRRSGDTVEPLFHDISDWAQKDTLAGSNAFREMTLWIKIANDFPVFTNWEKERLIGKWANVKGENKLVTPGLYNPDSSREEDKNFIAFLKAQSGAGKAEPCAIETRLQYLVGLEKNKKVHNDDYQTQATEEPELSLQEVLKVITNMNDQLSSGAANHEDEAIGQAFTNLVQVLRQHRAFERAQFAEGITGATGLSSTRSTSFEFSQDLVDMTNIFLTNYNIHRMKVGLPKVTEAELFPAPSSSSSSSSSSLSSPSSTPSASPAVAKPEEKKEEKKEGKEEKKRGW